MLAMLIFLALDGHLLMLNALAESFHTLPVADAPLASGGWMFLVLGGGEIFSSGLMLSLPLITALLTLNLAMKSRSEPMYGLDGRFISWNAIASSTKPVRPSVQP